MDAESSIAFRLARRLIRVISPAELQEEIEGDLLQRFERDCVRVGGIRARWRLFWNAVRFCRPGILMRNRFSFNPGTSMISHFIKVFTRTSARDGLYTAINVSGLAVGLAAAIFIGMWVFDEWSYDTHHKDRDRIFQVMGSHHFPSGIEVVDDNPAPMAAALASLQMVEVSARIIDPFRNQLFKVGSVSFYEQGFFCDSSIFNILTFRWIEGNPARALGNHNSIVISERMATKYFGNEKALGKELQLQANESVTVTGVFENYPTNSTLVFDYILPYSIYSSRDQYRDEWGSWSGGITLVKLRDPAYKDAVTQQMHEQFTKPHIWVRWDNNVHMFLHDMKDWRLRGTFVNGVQSGREDQILGLAIVAGFILLMASANFINLATARVARRAREIGVRKVIGARRPGLVIQFMTESFAITVLAAIVAILLVLLATPNFEEVTSKTVEWDRMIGWLVASVGGLILLTSVVAGIYPSFFLSSIEVVSAVKGGSPAMTGAGLRKGLIVFQFALSVIFIVGSLVVFQQLEYMRKKDLGFDRENSFFFNYREPFGEHFEKFKADVITHPSIKHIVRTSSNPMQLFGGMVLADDAWPGKTPEEDLIFITLDADAEFLETMGFKIIEGRSFSGAPADSSSYILNEAAVKAMKLTDPIGVTIKAPTPGTVIGVVKDFHSSPLRDKFQKVIISTRFDDFGVILVKYEPGQIAEALAAVDAAYRKVDTDFPIEITFMDETFANQYGDEILMSKLASICTAVALFISCMGLFGLISFSAERRRKEIGIRKVLGADLSTIVSLLSRDTLSLLLIACAVGVPLSIWAANEFLGRFAFHTSINYWLTGLSVLTMVLIALVTISFQSVRAGKANPADTLRSE
jgi:putative ABC transport system permease protein